MSNSEAGIGETKYLNKISNETKSEEKEKQGDQIIDALTDVERINDVDNTKKNHVTLKNDKDHATIDAVISPSRKSNTKEERIETTGESTTTGVKPREKNESKTTTCVERDKSDKAHELPIPRKKTKEGEPLKGKENGQLKLNEHKNKKENEGNEPNSDQKIKDNQKPARKQTDEAENKDGKKLTNWVAGLPAGAIRNLGNTGLKGQSLPLFLSMPSGGAGGLSLLSAGLPPGRYVILPSTTSSIPSISNIAPSMSSLTLGKSSIVAQISNKSISLVQGASSAVTTTTAAVTSISPSVIHPVTTTSTTTTATTTTEQTHARAPTGRTAPAGRSFRGRRKSYTTAEKLAMIEAVESGQKKSNVADQFGVAPSTLACILLQKNKIRCDQIKIDMSRRRIRRTRTLPIVPGPAGKHSLGAGRRDSERAGDNPFVHFLSPLSPPRPTVFEESPEEIFSMPDLSERMGMENQPSPGKLEGSSSYLTCSPIISTMSGLHEDMMSGAGPSSSCQESGDNESMHQDYDQDDIDVKSEPVFNVEPEICEDESQNNTQSSCDRRSSQSSPAPAGMAGPYLLKKETHCTTILDQLLRDDTFCDVTLTAEGQSMRAHKIVLCLASAYFRQVLSKEANVQNVIVFRDIKFAELKNLINFIYTGEATVDAAELESFMKTAEMLEVTSLCDGQRKIPKNLIPKPRDTESERTRTNIPTKRALNASSTPPPAKSRKVDDSFKTTKSISQASTSGGTTHQSSVLHQTPQVFLHSPPVIKSEPATEDENPEEEFRTFESLTQSPGYQESDTTQSTDNDTGPSVNKAPVGGCPFCPSLDQILTGVTLTQHLSTTHPDKTVYPCQTCSRVFLKKGAYDQHIENCNR